MILNGHQERLMTILLGPHVSEKASARSDKDNQVVFKVRRDATKQEIRQAVQTLFEVEVDKVTVVRVPGKMRKYGRTIGRRSSWKKAYVRLAPGHDINFLGSE